MKSSYNKHFLDLVYTPDAHHENLLIYNNIANKIIKDYKHDEYKNESINDYYNHISNMYMLIENFVEDGVYDVSTYLKEIIMNNWFILTNDPLDIDITIDDLQSIYDNKNWRYGNASEFAMMYDSPFANKVILAHKVKRIKSFIIDNINLGDESFMDSIEDLTNYCMIYLIWIDKGMPMLRDVKVAVN